MAETILLKFVDPGLAEEALTQTAPDQAGDHVFAQSVLFMRDALIFCVFEDSIRHGDPGMVLKVIKFWIYAFRGAGCTNYTRESLNVTLTWAYELSPDLKEALEHSWFYNRFGKEGGNIPIDLYLEHMNYWVKVRLIHSFSVTIVPTFSTVTRLPIKCKEMVSLSKI